MLAIVCPGQGSQSPGFLTPWLEFDGVRTHLERLAQSAGVDLVHYGTEADAESIKDTSVAQPLIVAASLISGSTVLKTLGLESFGPDTVHAGHSVGEIAAASNAGIFDHDTAMAFVRERAGAMKIATEAVPTGMIAIIGGDQEQVLAAVEQAGLQAANVNVTGQIVAGGEQSALESFKNFAPEKTRVVPLKVAGAFHTSFMKSAQESLSSQLEQFTAADPHSTILSNADGQEVSSGPDYLQALVDQVASPVRWDLCMSEMSSRGVTGVLELCPAGTLSALAKRGMPGVDILAVKSPENLEAAQAFVREHARQENA